jgi:CheY-like chemotaxis protein
LFSRDAEYHRGQVNDPAPPKGTCITPSGVHGVLQGMRIVIVDDDDDARDLLMILLTQRAASVFPAGSAAEALTLVQREHPDAIVSDIAMPDEDGYMLIERVRALPDDAGGRTPAIAVTAYTGRGDREHVIAAGFDVHCGKPIDLDSLVTTLVELRAKGATSAPRASGASSNGASGNGASSNGASSNGASGNGASSNGASGEPPPASS